MKWSPCAIACRPASKARPPFSRSTDRRLHLESIRAIPASGRGVHSTQHVAAGTGEAPEPRQPFVHPLRSPSPERGLLERAPPSTI